VERLALAVIPQALRPGGAALVIDPRQEFFPRGALPLGIELDQLIVLRPRSLEDALWGAEQALRCPAVDVVVSWNELLPRGRHPDRVFRRLQLAAEEGGVLGVLLRPGTARRWKCWGDVRIAVECLPVASGTKSARRGEPESPLSAEPGKEAERSCFQLALLHCRGALPGRRLILELDHETGALRLVSELADPASGGGAVGA
jgi:hypothetical protein